MKRSRVETECIYTKDEIDELEAKRVKTEPVTDKTNVIKDVSTDTVQAPVFYMVFDTETTGLPTKTESPYIVELAWVLLDENGVELNAKSYIVKPNGYDIPEESVKIHQITNDQATLYGVDIKDVMQDFVSDLKQCQVLVAHNFSFDEKMVKLELDRLHLTDDVLKSAKQICTMKESTRFCGLQNPYARVGSDMYKWPKLSELHQKLFGEEPEESHRALPDARVTAKCFLELQRQNIL